MDAQVTISPVNSARPFRVRIARRFSTPSEGRAYMRLESKIDCGNDGSYVISSHEIGHDRAETSMGHRQGAWCQKMHHSRNDPYTYQNERLHDIFIITDISRTTKHSKGASVCCGKCITLMVDQYMKDLEVPLHSEESICHTYPCQ